MGRGRKGGRGSQAPLTPAFPPTFPLQAQTRAALLRVLQENEEHWGSTEDRPSSLAQDVCEVGGGEEEGESAERCPGGKAGPTPSSPLLLAMDHAAARGAHGASTPHQPGVWGADGPLLPGGAGGIPAEVQRAPVGGGAGGARLVGGGISTQDPTERGEMKGNQVRTGRGASGMITGFAGLSAQQETLLQQCSICHTSSPSPVTSFQQRVERFHENPGVPELLPDTHISRTISLVNCGPPLR